MFEHFDEHFKDIISNKQNNTLLPEYPKFKPMNARKFEVLEQQQKNILS